MKRIKKEVKRIVVLTLAIVFLLLGLAGLVLPILQGWFFLALSLLLFAIYSPALQAWIDKHTVKYPKVHAWVGKAQDWIARFIGRPE